MRRESSLQPLRKHAVQRVLVFTLAFICFVCIQETVYADNHATQQLQGLSQAFRDVAKHVSPAVVYISTVQTVKSNLSQNPFGNDEFFRRFFGVPQQPREYQRQGLGSGFIVSEDGYILTNNHVVGEADKITVKLADNREFEAEIVGADPKSDVAVIKIVGDDLPVVDLGDSGSIEVGDWAVAIGNPYGLSQTVTAGIISAKGRADVGIVDYEDFIQTDAAINPGNSGGPLVNIEGAVIGINTAIFSRSGGYQGIGFAIPINMAKTIMDSLITKGKVVRGYLGVFIQDVTPEIAEGFELDETTGALVADLVENGPAAQAGIERGDVIVEFDGHTIVDANVLKNLAAQTPIDKEVAVVVVRNGKKQTLQITIVEQDVEAASDPGTAPVQFGMSVQELTPDIAKQLGYEDESGVIIANVEAGSPAAEAGLRRGDLIKEINRQTVESLADYKKAMSSAGKGDALLLLVKRGANTHYIVVNAE